MFEFKTPVGIIRSLDNVGRCSIPKEWRRLINLNTKDTIEIQLNREDKCLYIRRINGEQSSGGIIRHVDNLGRFVIPKNWVDQLNLGENNPIEIQMDFCGTIMIRKFLIR